MNKIGQQTTDNRQQTLSVSIKKFMAHGSWLMALIFIISSCSTHKETTNLRNLSANHIIREVEDNRFGFDNLEATILVRLEGDNLHSLKGQLRMQNDSVIWISLSLKIGIEVGRIMITHDSVKFINRNTRTYISEDIGFLKDVFPVDATFGFLQDLLVGNISNMKRDEKYKASIDNGRYKLETDKDGLLANDIWVTPKDFKISRYNIEENLSHSSIEFQYDDFVEVGGKLMPSKINFSLSSNYDINLEIKYSDIKMAGKLTFPFNISKKYDKTYLW